MNPTIKRRIKLIPFLASIAWKVMTAPIGTVYERKINGEWVRESRLSNTIYWVKAFWNHYK